VYRVLKPGGRFYATTFFAGALGAGGGGGAAAGVTAGMVRSMRFFDDAAELEALPATLTLLPPSPSS